MDTRELLRKITRLPIAADALSDDMLSGNFRSVFKGQGMEFDEARHYQWGDDAKSIDWNASARLGTPFIKLYREERELTILILLDVSASMHSCISSLWENGDDGGETGDLTPYEQALTAAALIAFSAERAGQRVGAFLFDRETERVFPPRKGKSGVLAIVSGALQYHRPEGDGYKAGAGGHAGRLAGSHAGGKGGGKNSGEKDAEKSRTSNVRAALIGAGRLLKRRSMVVVLSDFLSTGWEQELSDLCRRHDVIAVRVFDPAEENFPDLGLVSIEDPETGLRLAAPTGAGSFRAAWSNWYRDRSDLWTSLCGKAGAAHLALSVKADAVAALTRFFGGRNRR